MMIARLPRVTQWGLFVAVLSLALAAPSTSYGQGYTNPRYQSAPKKGEPVQLPSYSTPSHSAPSHSPNYYSAPAESGSANNNEGEHRMQIGVNLHYPVGMGDAGGSLKSRFGADVQLYFAPFVSDELDNYISGGWDMFLLKSDADSKLHLIPVAFGLEFKTDPRKMFNPKFGVAAGAAFAWVGVANSQTLNARAYFLAQLKPGLDINMDGWSIVLQTPVSFLIGSSKMSYVAYSVGARFGL